MVNAGWTPVRIDTTDMLDGERFAKLLIDGDTLAAQVAAVINDRRRPCDTHGVWILGNGSVMVSPRSTSDFTINCAAYPRMVGVYRRPVQALDIAADIVETLRVRPITAAALSLDGAAKVRTRG